MVILKIFGSILPFERILLGSFGYIRGSLEFLRISRDFLGFPGIPMGSVEFLRIRRAL